jgi:hypothetical protein
MSVYVQGQAQVYSPALRVLARREPPPRPHRAWWALDAHLYSTRRGPLLRAGARGHWHTEVLCKLARILEAHLRARDPAAPSHDKAITSARPGLHPTPMSTACPARYRQASARPSR